MAAQKKSILYCGKSNNSTTKKLFDAIRRREEVSTIQALLQEGVDIDARDLKGRTPLLIACLQRQKQIVDLLIKSGANVDCKCEGDKLTALHYASRYGWTEIVKFLVNKVSDLNARDSKGETPMHLATSSAHLKVVECLLAQEGTDIDCKNPQGFTSLLYAARYSFIFVFELLLNSKANIDGSERVLLYYALSNRWAETVQFLVKRLPDLNERYVKGEIVFDATLERGHLEVVKLLVEEGTDIDREMIGQRALFHASREGHLEVVKWLVMKRVDLNARNRKGGTSLQIASMYGRTEIVKCLVEEGADINMKDYSDLTALYDASLYRHTEIVKYLVEEGADVNIKNYWGNTPLHIASLNGHLEIVKYLVEKGADVNVSNQVGITPSMCAALSYRANSKDVVDQLLSSGANVDAFSQEKNTLLHMSAVNGWLDTTQFLVKRVCDVDARDQAGQTALSRACCFQHLDVAQALLQAGASWDTSDVCGNSPLNCITMNKNPKYKLVKLFIENGAYLKPYDYDSLVKSSSLEVLQDSKLCSQSILNRFNNLDLPELYKLPAFRSLPHIENMKIVSTSEVAQSLEQTVGFEIRTKGHYNILEISPMALSIFSVRSVLEYYKTSGLKKGLKRPAAFESVNNYQNSNKSLRLA